MFSSFTVPSEGGWDELIDKVKTGFDKAQEGMSDFAETTKLRHDVSKLTDRKTEVCTEIGRQIYNAQGAVPAEVERHCKEIMSRFTGNQKEEPQWSSIMETD